MPRIWTPAVCCAACLLMTVPAPSAETPAASAETPGASTETPAASETLLPPSTKGFLSITDVQELTDRWNRTQVGQLMQDPVMEPFAKDLRRQLEDRWSGFRDKLGLTLDDLKDVPGGEVALGVIQPGPDHTAVAILVDVTDHHEQAEELLKKVSKNLTKQGAKRTETTLAGTPVIQFDLPKKDGLQRRAVYFLKGDLLGASDNLEVLEGILQRASGKGGKSLADSPAFKAVMDRCQTDLGEDATPQVRWFVEPLGYAELLRAAIPERDRRKGKSMLDIVKNQGFAAMQGIGGFLDLAVDHYELLHRTAVYAPEPYEKSMKMLVFPNGTEFAPQGWVPRDVATYSTGYVDVLNAFDNLGSLFDEVFGEGEEGVWEDVLESLKKDKKGPRIDLRNELFAHLDNRLTVITDYQLPITPTSERLLFALQTKDEQKAAAGLEKTLKNDKGVRKRVFEGHVIWETVPKEKPKVPTISLEVPPLGPEPEEDEDDEGGAAAAGDDEPQLFPNLSMTVANGHLMIASHLDFLIKVLRKVEKRETLARSIDYMTVDATLKELGAGQNCARTFSCTDEEYRPTYELIRQGKMPESETMLGRVLNTLFGAGKKGVARKQQIDGTQLPDFEFVRRYLGPAGMFATSEETGWFFKGFIIPKGLPLKPK